MAPERTDSHNPAVAGTTEAALAAERARLVRLCARLTGDANAAEDLAQQTLLEAWRLRERLHALSDGDVRARWHSAIARNICLRWLRSSGRERARLAAPIPHAQGNEPGITPPHDLDDALAGDTDVELELERDELADLLDRALALLPPLTRDILIARFIHEKPQAEVAARLGVTEDVIAQRLHRGKLSLRRVLTTDLRHEAAPYLAIAPEPDQQEPLWQETRIWCPFCGCHRLRCFLDRESGTFGMHCAGNCLDGINVVGMATDPTLVGGLSSPKSLLARHCLALSTYYRQRIAERTAVCPECGGPAEVRMGNPAEMGPHPLLAHAISLHCPRCGDLDSATPHHLTIDTPQAIAFWRRHPRMRTLPIREIEYAGRSALLTGFESVGESARVEIISARDSWETLHSREEGGAR